MQSLGTDQPVVVKKLMKVSGAKGLNYLSYSLRQPNMGGTKLNDKTI
jgi:hypothetical protein